ncbi:MAG TPA: rod-binding protein [Solirubrobacteraceae bacterium]|nr:rod-binding protein [Solirubrobacteraceae bacterium]
MSASIDLPPLAAGTVLPADVRAGGAAAEKEYRTALAFERVLLGQLTKAMQATVPGEDDDATAATKTYRDMLPDTMADALSAGGGIGLADNLYRSLKTGGR